MTKVNFGDTGKQPFGYQMINSIEIKNFKCFEHLKIDKCRRINLIVGENGSGKTALLEAIFLALGSSPSIMLRYRQQRGLEGSVTGSPQQIEKEIWQEYFFNNDWNHPVEIKLRGDGLEGRSVKIQRGPSQETFPLLANSTSIEQGRAPIEFTWTAADGKEYSSVPKITEGGIDLPGTDEELPNFLYFSANQPIVSTETAQRFSGLDKRGKAREFIDVVVSEYKWIKDIDIQASGGLPVLHATIAGLQCKIPLANVSGGINRIVAIMLAIHFAAKAVVLVDEIENGLYYNHQSRLWSSLITMAKKAECQLILTTHSEEWLNAVVDAVGDDFDDIALWRVERSDSGPIVHQFAGKKVLQGIAAGEVR